MHGTEFKNLGRERIRWAGVVVGERQGLLPLNEQSEEAAKK